MGILEINSLSLWPRMNNKTNILEQANAKLEAYLVEKNLRRTPERFEILRVVVQTEELFTIDELAEIMSREAKFQVSRATLFNVLEVLVDARIVIKHTLTRAARYECHLSGKPVICLVCDRCGRTEKMEKAELEAILKTVKSKKLSITRQILYLSGTCRRCEMAERRRKKASQEAAKPKGKLQ